MIPDRAAASVHSVVGFAHNELRSVSVNFGEREAHIEHGLETDHMLLPQHLLIRESAKAIEAREHGNGRESSRLQDRNQEAIEASDVKRSKSNMSAFLAGVHHIQSKIEIEKSRRVGDCDNESEEEEETETEGDSLQEIHKCINRRTTNQFTSFLPFTPHLIDNRRCAAMNASVERMKQMKNTMSKAPATMKRRRVTDVRRVEARAEEADEENLTPTIFSDDAVNDNNGLKAVSDGPGTEKGD
ncbi:hypothetical protein PRIPAC_72367 [Pristionchus pacificus]|uniref:Uncharacterized protein n=1 Tax=Pristionchus pacificus TaxID=54126 RepID=A0A2A6C0E5_PRIPA|nr:hypothetical protein PRIPAC_72367 [Pristionchus pacificus]|eukprot:PDM71483.1 hypothetical protein PRIPAC_37890 [Pristionchus pacificus]